jgi:hypothetical protein
MTDLKLSSAELEHLASKMNELEKSLTPEERAMLLGIFGIASAGLTAAVAKADQVHKSAQIAQRVAGASRVTVDSGSTAHMPTLGEGFRSAFVAGRAGSFRLGGLGPVEDSVGVSVGGPCVSVSWSKTLSDFQSQLGEVIDIGAIDVAGSAGALAAKGE